MIAMKVASPAIGAASVAHQLQQLQCNDTQTLLRVSYNLTQDDWDSILPSNDDDGHFSSWELPKLNIRPSGENYYNYSSAGEYHKYHVEQVYESFEDVVDFDMCFPAEGACLEVTMAIFPKGSYTISWDGKPVDTGPQFNYPRNWKGQVITITSTEVGNYCIPVCGINEAMFEFQMWSGEYSKIDPYRVEDEQSGTKVLGCDKSRVQCEQQIFSHQLYKHRSCLEKEQTCYRFLIGDEYRGEEGDYFSVLWDGELVMESYSWLFKSSKFGKGCTPDCDPEDELVELFVRRFDVTDSDCQSNEEFPWTLTLNGQKSDSDMLLASGSIPGCSNTVLFHDTMCVPKGRCASFYISSAKKNLSPAYYLSMDSIVYRSGNWYLFNELNQTTNMGSCSVDELCNQAEQALFQADLQMPNTYGTQHHIDSWSVHWTLGWNRDVDQSYSVDTTLLRSSDYVRDYDLGYLYRTIECIPSEECAFDFAMYTSDSEPVGTYVVERNGMELTSRVKADEGWWTGYTLTAFGLNCNPQTSLSGGAIAGIVIACVVALGGAVYGFMWYKKHKMSTVVEEDNNTALSEDLLSSTL